MLELVHSFSSNDNRGIFGCTKYSLQLDGVLSKFVNRPSDFILGLKTEIESALQLVDTMVLMPEQ